MTLYSAVSDFCSRHGFLKTYWVAYSGGLDSHVLLSLCHSLRAHHPIKLRAIHINHGLSQHANAWARHCARICKAYDIEFIEHSVQLELSAGESLEEAARDKRYATLAEYLHEDDVLLTAHHQDDQAETVLLQLIRGAGPKGLSAMPSIKPFAKGFHGRPLLSFSRATLQQYANLHQLEWIDDESNCNLNFTRNYLRHEILPRLKSRWPSVTATISRSASHCGESQVLLEEFATEAWKNTRGGHEETLSVDKLLSLDPSRQRLMLRAWIKYLGHPIPDMKKIETIRNNVLTAAWDRTPCVRWQDVELRRYRDDLYLMAALPQHDAEQVFSWDLTYPLSIPGMGTLHASLVEGQGLRTTIHPISIRFRLGGERVSVSGRGHQVLKNLFQAWGVPPWLRDRIPLVFVGDELVSVVGYFMDATYVAKQNEMGYQLTLEKNPSQT